jgi:hypothetical protein
MKASIDIHILGRHIGDLQMAGRILYIENTYSP